MRVSSIDDVVEHWMIGASTFMTHLGSRSRRAGPMLASHRRTIVLVAFVAIGFLFNVLYLLGILFVPLILCLASICLARMTEDDQA